jgi:hypothetical protein
MACPVPTLTAKPRCALQVTPITDHNGTRYVSDMRIVAHHYVRSWFLIDLLSIAVSSFDYVGLLLGSQDSLQNFKVLRTLRTLRLIKLAKLITGLRVIKRWEVKIASA